MKIQDFDIFWISSWSKECQDLFAYITRTLMYKTQAGGTFLDVGCYNPFTWNNTASLELAGWKGAMFDIDEKNIELCKKVRNSSAFVCDVSSDKFHTILSQCVPRHFDYISLDVDGASLKALKNIIRSKVTFDTMTFEHADDNEMRLESRRLLEAEGYRCLFRDILLEEEEHKGMPFEDWWVSERAHQFVFNEKCFDALTVTQAINKLADIAEAYDVPGMMTPHDDDIQVQNMLRFDIAKRQAKLKV